MKKFYSLLAVVAMTAAVNAQVFSENMGTGASGNPVVNVLFMSHLSWLVT